MYILLFLPALLNSSASICSQATEKLVSVKRLLPLLPRSFHRCDPARQIEGTTYVRMTELLQVRARAGRTKERSVQ